MLEELRDCVFRANLDLVKRGLVVGTFGNASGIDETRKLVVIKPSGIPYEDIRPEDLPIVDVTTGKVVDGRLKPSSDTLTHLVIYRRCPAIGGVVHTHSHFATAWSQAQREIPCFGTTHADYAPSAIPCTRLIRREEVETSVYEENTGVVIMERLRDLNPMDFPGILVAGHAPFAWGRTPEGAVDNAFHLELIAGLAAQTLSINPGAEPIPDYLIRKHFLRKHGPAAYYGQQ